jgi:hypothetical protein
MAPNKGDPCDDKSDACHAALEQLREILLAIGFHVYKKQARYATLQVYLARGSKYPLLNPRFCRYTTDGGGVIDSLEITVISKEDHEGHERLKERVRDFIATPACFLIPDQEPAPGGYFYQGRFVFPLKFIGPTGSHQIDFKALRKPLDDLFEFLST